MQKLDPFCIACGDVQWCSCCGKEYCSSSNEDHVIQQSHFRAQTQKLVAGSQLSLHPCSWQHIHKNQNVQATQCPSVDGWINRMWSIHTMEYLCVSVHEHSCAQPCLCDPMDHSPPGSSVHGIFQARILEWFAISYSRGSSRPRD